jgi:predicted lipoprotein
MLHRVFPLLLAVLAVALFVAGPVLAADTTEGMVVKVGDGKLTMTDKDGKEQTHTVADTAKITCDGKECKLTDLKKGFKVKVTTEKKDDKVVITKIDAEKS